MKEEVKRVDFLNQVSNVIREVIVPQKLTKLLDTTLKIIINNFNLQFVWLGLIDEKTKLVKPVAYNGFCEEYIKQIKVKFDNSKYGGGPTGTAIKTKKFVLNNFLEKNPKFKPWVNTAKKYSFKSTAAFPLITKNKVIGALNIYSKKGNFFNEDFAFKIQIFADCIAVAIDNANTYEELQKEKIQWERTFNSISDYISIIDKNFKIIKANYALCKALNKSESEIINKKCYKIYHRSMCPREKCVLNKTFKTLKSQIDEFEDKKIKKTFLVTTSPLFNDEGTVNSIIHIAKDISELKNLKENLVQSEKMSAVSELIASITNEIKNPLSAIICYSQILKNKLPEDNLKDYAKTIFEEANNVDSTIEKLSSIIKHKKPVHTKVDLNKIISNTTLFTTAELKNYNIKLINDLDRKLPLISADENQIQQVLLNLIINAQQAILRDKKTGENFIKIKSYTKTCLFPDKNKQYKNKKVVCFEIIDNGIGIPKHLATKIFEPYFTNSNEKGIGMGLSICYEIIKKHKGNIYVKDSYEELTVIVVELPVS